PGVGRPAGGTRPPLGLVRDDLVRGGGHGLPPGRILKWTAQPLRLDSTAQVAAEDSRRADLNPWGRRSASGGAVPTPGLAGQHSCFLNLLPPQLPKACHFSPPFPPGPPAAAHSSKYSSTVSSVGSAVPEMVRPREASGVGSSSSVRTGPEGRRNLRPV